MIKPSSPGPRGETSRLVVVTAAVLLLVGAYVIHAQSPSPAPATLTSTATTANPMQDSTTTTAKLSKEELKKKLTPEQFNVTCNSGTEPPFHNAYWNNHKPGIYVDLISGKPLFSSLDKFDSGTGWPSFTKPIVTENLKSQNDSTLGMDREEVRSKDSDAHLGHVFDDGPSDKGGLRYCINSAALRFVPVEKLKEEGYAEYLPMFEKAEKK